MLPGRIVPPPAGFAQIEPILRATRGTNFGSQTINREPTTPAPGVIVGSSRAVDRPAVGPSIQHAAPGPRSGIVYDPATGLYVNDPRSPSRATQAANELSSPALPLPPVASGLRAVEPSSATSPKVGPAAAAQSHGSGWFHHSSPRSDSSSPSASRSGVVAPGSHAKASSSATGTGASGGSGSRGGGSTSAAAGAGGGGMGGGFHGGGGSSSGGHR